MQYASFALMFESIILKALTHIIVTYTSQSMKNIARRVFRWLSFNRYAFFFYLKLDIKFMGEGKESYHFFKPLNY